MASPPPPTPLLVRASDALIDAAIIALATWTLVYHVCLVLRLGVGWAVPLEGGLLALGGVLFVRYRRSAAGVSTGTAAQADVAAAPLDQPERGGLFARWPARVAFVCASALALFTAAAAAVEAPWLVVTIGWIAAAVAGTSYAVLAVAPHWVDLRSSRWEGWLALLAATAVAALSLSILRSNPDDIYYVNLSQFVAETGTFPLRDSIFANLVYPMSSWPPMASYDALSGTVAHLAGVRAAPIVYIVAPAIAGFLSVLALWRLLRTWRVTVVSAALTSGLVFLLLDGLAKHGPGNLFVSRLYQAKFVYLCVMVPVLLVYALTYVERPTRSRLLWLFAGGVAAVGVTTSAMFLTPVIAAAGAAPLLRRAPKQALLAFSAMAAYPLAAGAVTKAVGGRSADSFDHGLARFDPAVFTQSIFHHGGLAFVAVVAVLLGPLLVPHPAGRMTTGLLALVVGVTYIPGVTELSFDVIGLGPTLWRMSWLLTMAALVGVAVTRLTQLVSPRLNAVGPAFLAVLLLVVSDPIWAGSTHATWSAPFHLQRDPETIVMADRVIDGAEAGDLVLAPENLAITITVLTTTIHSVVPRGYFMEYLKDEPGFHYESRLALASFANGGTWQPREVLRGLQRVGVDLVCLRPAQPDRLRMLTTAGYRSAYSSAEYRCLSPR